MVDRRHIAVMFCLTACATGGVGIRGYSLVADAPQIAEAQWRRGSASVVVRRESDGPREDSLIRVAESLRASRAHFGQLDGQSDVSDPAFPDYWGHSIGGSLILPYALDSTTLRYLLARASRIGERWPDTPPPPGSTAPSTPAVNIVRLDYTASAERQLNPEVPGSSYVVELRLVYSEGSISFIKRREVWFNRRGAILAVRGDGVTVPVLGV